MHATSNLATKKRYVLKYKLDNFTVERIWFSVNDIYYNIPFVALSLVRYIKPEVSYISFRFRKQHVAFVWIVILNHQHEYEFHI